MPTATYAFICQTYLLHTSGSIQVCICPSSPYAFYHTFQLSTCCTCSKLFKKIPYNITKIYISYISISSLIGLLPLVPLAPSYQHRADRRRIGRIQAGAGGAARRLAAVQHLPTRWHPTRRAAGKQVADGIDIASAVGHDSK